MKYLKKEMKHVPFIILAFVLMYGAVMLINHNNLSKKGEKDPVEEAVLADEPSSTFQHSAAYNGINTSVSASETVVGNATLNTSAQTVSGAINEINSAVASTSNYGRVKLSSSLTSTSESLAATAYAAKQVKDAIDVHANNLGVLNFANIGSLTYSTSKTWTFPNNGRYIIIAIGSSVNYRGMYMVQVGGAGAMSTATVHQGSGISFSTATNQVTITGKHESSSTAIYVYAINLTSYAMPTAS